MENELPDLKLPEFPTPTGIHDDHSLRWVGMYIKENSRKIEPEGPPAHS